MTGTAAAVRTFCGASIVVLAVSACTPANNGSPSIAAPGQSSLAASVSPPAGDGPISALLTEFDLALSAASAPAGVVVFEVRNAGELPHELTLIRTELDAADLPFEGIQVVEDGLDLVAKVEDIGAGETATLTADLESGHYVLICNLPGHYESGIHGPGMQANFDVN